MAGAFESATRVAIDEIIAKHARESKFGFILTPESFKELSDDLFNLLLMSRTLKSAGDRLLRMDSAPANPNTRSPHARR